jgi:hypothetical protein
MTAEDFTNFSNEIENWNPSTRHPVDTLISFINTDGLGIPLGCESWSLITNIGDADTSEICTLKCVLLNGKNSGFTIPFVFWVITQRN